MSTDYLIYILLFLGVTISSCSTTGKLERTPQVAVSPYFVDIPMNASIMEIDELGNIYVLDYSNNVVKMDSTGRTLYKYSTSLLGDIDKIDATNPHKILIFLSDFQIVKILDNTLSEITSFDLSSVSSAITQVAMSNDNNIWVYDLEDNRIKKITTKGELVISSQPMSDIVGASFVPTYMHQVGNTIMIYDPNFGMITLDHILSYERIDNVKNLEVSEVSVQTIISVAGKLINLHSLRVNIEPSTDRAVKLDYRPLIVRKGRNSWYILSAKGITKYKEL